MTPSKLNSDQAAALPAVPVDGDTGELRCVGGERDGGRFLCSQTRLTSCALEVQAIRS